MKGAETERWLFSMNNGNFNGQKSSGAEISGQQMGNVEFIEGKNREAATFTDDNDYIDYEQNAEHACLRSFTER